MTAFQLLTTIFVLTSIFGYINLRFIKLPMSIGLLFFSTFISIVLYALGYFHIIDSTYIKKELDKVDFENLLLNGLLSLLLFSGALQINISNLKHHKIAIGLLATLGVLASTFFIGIFVYLFSQMIGFNIPFLYCLLFGSLISPTDAVAVLSILNGQHIKENIKNKIIGESLFNDGMGVVLFITILSLISSNTITENSFSYSIIPTVAWNISLEIGGGVVIGLFFGLLVTYILSTIDQYEVEIMISLSLAMGSYVIAQLFHVSAPIASVVAGLVIGNKAKTLYMSEKTREHVDVFFKLTDDILNSILFVLIGLTLIIIQINIPMLAIGFFSIFAVLIGRYLSLIFCGIFLIKTNFNFKHYPTIMTWCGMRGAISVALALSLPQSDFRDSIITITYIVVLFSILIQGTTIPWFMKKFK